jgi:hypothetical protein
MEVTGERRAGSSFVGCALARQTRRAHLGSVDAYRVKEESRVGARVRDGLGLAVPAIPTVYLAFACELTNRVGGDHEARGRSRLAHWS